LSGNNSGVHLLAVHVSVEAFDVEFQGLCESNVNSGSSSLRVFAVKQTGTVPLA
jgi:hypothetical protein